MSIAAPAACSTRKAISTCRSGASAQPSDATPNTTRPVRKHVRRPIRSAARPAGSSSAASTMAYTSRIQETSDSDAGANSRCSVGSAMLTTHRSRTVRNGAADSTASTTRRRPRNCDGSSCWPRVWRWCKGISLARGPAIARLPATLLIMSLTLSLLMGTPGGLAGRGGKLVSQMADGTRAGGEFGTAGQCLQLDRH